LNRNESGRFGALKSDSTHHFCKVLKPVEEEILKVLNKGLIKL
jgi:hypothetical protein